MAYTFMFWYFYLGFILVAITLGLMDPFTYYDVLRSSTMYTFQKFYMYSKVSLRTFLNSTT